MSLRAKLFVTSKHNKKAIIVHKEAIHFMSQKQFSTFLCNQFYEASRWHDQSQHLNESDWWIAELMQLASSSSRIVLCKRNSGYVQKGVSIPNQDNMSDSNQTIMELTTELLKTSL